MPPPASPEAQFWNVFASFTAREYETDRLIFGQSGEGSGGAGNGELVVELIVRGPGDGGGRRVSRVLEGWSPNAGPCDLRDLVMLKDIWSARVVEEVRSLKM
jgi:elongator complex protein 5